MRVQLTRSRVLKISGARPLGNNRWSSFQKDFPVSENCDTNKISAKFEDGILYVRQPKLIVPAEKDDKKITPLETPKPAEEPPSPAAKIDQERHDNTEKTTSSVDDHIKQSGVEDFQEKSDEKKEAKSTKDKEKISESEGGKKDERNYIEEKTGGAIDDDRKVNAAPKRASDKKREKVSGTNKIKALAKVDDYDKMNAAAPSAILKMARQKMMNILVLLFVFVLGMYVSNLPWFSRKADEN